ncbi:glycosyl hydrolase family 28-related protein [Acidisarcina polymorpha]|nr:glycosyl hydrolase family 28-related protein [Acidisarcina polymorpha]
MSKAFHQIATRLHASRRGLQNLAGSILQISLTAILPLAMGLVATAQAPATTAIHDVIYRADGSPAAGTLIVSWPGFTTATNVAIGAGSITVPIGANGAVSFSLAANALALPGGTYYTAVYHLSDGTVNKEYWVVPAATSVTLSEIRSQLVPATVAIQAVSKQYVDAAVSAITGSYLSATGGTMLGPLLLSSDPTSAQQAADKHYVDDSVGSLLPLSGGSLTGPLTLAADPTGALQAATKEYVDTSSGSAGGALTAANAAQAAANAAQATANAALPLNKVGVAGGVAALDGTARVGATNMPTAFAASVNTEIYAGSPQFGALCNWNGTTGADDTAAFQGAIAAATNAATAKTFQQGTQTVLVPTGTCKVSGELRIPSNVTLKGISKEGSILQQTSATANAITVTRCTNGIGGVGGPFVDCEGGIFDLTIEGNGHTSTGTLVEIDNVVSYRLQNLRLYNGGGRGLQLNGGTERLESHDLTIMLTRWPLVISNTSNESYFYNTKVLYPGQSADGYCYNVNCVNGVYPAAGAIAPDPHAAIYNYQGVNVGFYGGSIKSLQMMSGFKTFNSEETSVDHFYFELGFVNPGVIAGGIGDWTATTASMSATALSFPVQSTAWMPQFYTSPSDVPSTLPAYLAYTILPPDFLFGSTSGSVLGNGITRGTYEVVEVAGFAGDGKLYLGTNGRGASGTTAIAWPAGALIEARGTGIRSFKLTNSHVNAQDAFSVLGAPGANLTRNCDDSGVNTCAEIIGGYVPDGRWVQQRGSAGDSTTGPAVDMVLSNVSMFTGGVAGQGMLAAHSNLILELSGVNAGISPGEGYSVPSGASLVNVTGGSLVSVPTYANGSQALLTLVDDANQRTVGNISGIYKQTAAVYDGNGHNSIGEQIANENDMMDMPYWAAPGVPVLTAGGSVPAGSYSVRAAYTYAGGAGIVSPSVMAAVSAGQQMTVASPPADAAGLATGWNIYVGTSGNENLQNSTPLAIGSAFTLSTAPTTNLGILPLGCSAFCHPLYRFQFLGGPNYTGASAGIGFHKWNPQTSAWQTQFSVNGNGNLSTAGSGSFALGVSVSGGSTVTGGSTTDSLTATGNVSAAGSISSTTLTAATVTAGQINKVFYADGYPAAGCTVGSTVYTTELDCAAATADAWIAANNAGAKLVLGPGIYATCSGLILPSLNGYFGSLSIQGASQEQTIISQTCTIANAVIYHADAINGNLSRLLLRDFRVNANQKAPSCMDIFGVNESKIENINCSGAGGSDHFMKIGDTPANGSNGQVYQTPVSNVYITGNPLPSFATVTANVVGGSVTSYTVTSGGSNYGSTNQVYLLGYGYSKNPCQVMPTATVTVVGGVVTAVTPVTTGSNCSGAITVMISSLPAAAYGIVFGNFTDNTLYDVATGGVGTTAAIEVLEGDNVFYHFHPNGSPVGVSDYGNAYYGTECDSMYEYCFDVEGGTGIFGTTFTWNNATAYPLSAGYYISPNAFNAKIIGSMQCLTNVPSGYVQFWNQYGPVTSALPSGVTVVADRACSGTSQTLFGEPVYLNATNRASSTNNYFSQPLYFSDSFWNNIAPVNDPWQVVVGGTPSGTPTFENLNFYAPVGFYSTFQPSFKLSYNTSATSSLNYNSPGWDLNATYWDGTQSQSSDWIVKQSLGSGSSPISTLTFTPTKTGATALQAQVVVPSLQIVPGTAIQPACNATNRSLHWYVQGTPDHEQVCVQTATAGTYAWVQAF